MRLGKSTNRNSNYVPQRQVEFFSSGEQSHEKRKPGVGVGGGLNVRGLSLRRLLTMAAVSPADSTGPVDVALRNSLCFLFRHGAPETGVSRKDFDPAKDRRCSLARVYGSQRTKDSPTEKTVIIRGDLGLMMNVAKPNHQDRVLLRKNVQMAESCRYRYLVVASAAMGDNSELGTFRMEGLVNVRPVGTGLQDEDLTPTSDDWVCLRLWSVGLRSLHWLNVVLIVLLSATGYYIVDPSFGDAFFRGIETGFLMGWIRFIHFSCGFIWITVGLTRAFVVFLSRDRYMRWETFWPIHNRGDMKDLGCALGLYTFLHREGPLYVAHNPLQQLAYASIYIVGTLQMLIGLSLYALYYISNPVQAFIALPCSWFGIPITRLLRVMIMFLFWWFVIVYIYLAFRADFSGRHGGVSVMISGRVWMRHTSRPTDAPGL